MIVRLSDFKTNEYARLIGGAAFEPKEENPMLGFRGASRYAHPAYAAGFALECAALRRVRETMGLTNLSVMVPVLPARRGGAAGSSRRWREHGLKRGENGLEIYVMCEIPNNVIQIDAFAKLFDGFSIGSNDLTQLTLGVDRDFGDRRLRLRRARPRHVGDVPAGGRWRQAQWPPCRHLRRGACELSGDRTFLTGSGIDSISVNPASLIETMTVVAEAEDGIGEAARGKTGPTGLSVAAPSQAGLRDCTRVCRADDGRRSS